MTGITVLVCGGRDFRDSRRVDEVLLRLRGERGIATVIDGGAPGADTLAFDWAIARGIKTRTFKADWVRHGRAAGPIRNRQMLTEGRPDLVVAFPGGRGTADMVRAAREAGVEVLEITTAIQ